MLTSILSLFVPCFFFPRITIPKNIRPPSFSLIDNILASNIDETADASSVLLLKDLSDHNFFYIS